MENSIEVYPIKTSTNGEKGFFRAVFIIVVAVAIIAILFLYIGDVYGIRRRVWVKEAGWFVKKHQSELEKFIGQNVDIYVPEGNQRSVCLPEYRTKKVCRYNLQENSSMYVIGFEYKSCGLSVSGDYCDVYYSPDDIICGIMGQGKTCRDIEYDYQWAANMDNYIYKISKNWFVVFAIDP